MVKVERAATRQERARSWALHAQGGEAVTDLDHRKMLAGQRGAQALFKGRSLPGLALPTGLSKKGLPLGLQIIGRAFDEMTVFSVASAIEDAVKFNAVPQEAA